MTRYLTILALFCAGPVLAAPTPSRVRLQPQKRSWRPKPHQLGSQHETQAAEPRTSDAIHDVRALQGEARGHLIDLVRKNRNLDHPGYLDDAKRVAQLVGSPGALAEVEKMTRDPTVSLDHRALSLIRNRLKGLVARSRLPVEQLAAHEFAFGGYTMSIDLADNGSMTLGVSETGSSQPRKKIVWHPSMYTYHFERSGRVGTFTDGKSVFVVSADVSERKFGLVPIVFKGDLSSGTWEIYEGHTISRVLELHNLGFALHNGRPVLRFQGRDYRAVQLLGGGGLHLLQNDMGQHDEQYNGKGFSPVVNVEFDAEQADWVTKLSGKSTHEFQADVERRPRE